MEDGSDNPGSQVGLRERNLARNRAEVSDAALALFTEHGFDAVTVDDIAAEAGISRRTFFRYFDSKEDALLPYETERLELLRSVLAERPAGEPVLVSIRHATIEVITADLGEPSTMLARLKLVEQTPSVRARSLEMQSHWETAVCAVVADHLAVDPTTSVEARVVASTTIAALRAAMEVWLATDGERSVVDLLCEAYDVLTASLTTELTT